jgi:hypothetical protein
MLPGEIGYWVENSLVIILRQDAYCNEVGDISFNDILLLIMTLI